MLVNKPVFKTLQCMRSPNVSNRSHIITVFGLLSDRFRLKYTGVISVKTELHHARNSAYLTDASD
jgi:hypothetical protein